MPILFFSNMLVRAVFITPQPAAVPWTPHHEQGAEVDPCCLRVMLRERDGQTVAGVALVTVWSRSRYLAFCVTSQPYMEHPDDVERSISVRQGSKITRATPGYCAECLQQCMLE